MDLKKGYTQLLISESQKAGLSREQLAYLLATAYWETGRTMKPVKEAYWNSEDWRKENLRYYPWYGRGFVQLTWESNYKRAGQALGVDLVRNKDRALDPKIAAKIMVRGMIEGWFTGHKLSDHISLTKKDYVNARRIINGTDKKNEIAAIAVQYESDLKRQGYSTSGKKTSGTNLLDILINLFKMLFRGGKSSAKNVRDTTDFR